VDGKILEWILGKYGGRVWTGCIWFRIGTSNRPCKQDNETSSSRKYREFFLTS
jgi:hypothetical protein